MAPMIIVHDQKCKNVLVATKIKYEFDLNNQNHPMNIPNVWLPETKLVDY